MDVLPRRTADVLAPHVAARPDAVALVGEAGALTWVDLAGAVTDTARRLVAMGVRGGDRVMILGENEPTMAVLLLACSRIDAWAIPLNARLTAREVADIREHSGARVVFFCTGASPAAARHAGDAPVVWDGVRASAVDEAAVAEAVWDDPAKQCAALIYTSGTTGRPKGVMLSHRSLLFMAAMGAKVRGWRTDDVMYGVLPMSHVFGLANMLLGGLLAGATIRLVPRFDPDAMLAAIARDVSVIQGVPAIFSRLLARIAGPAAAPRLRVLSCGGSPMDPAVQQGLRRVFGLLPHNGYGLTEAGPTISQTREPRDDLSTGPIMEGVEARIAPDGEIEARGPGIMLGYYRDPAATRAAFTPDGFLRTGDLGRIDDEGLLWLVGRSRELIIRSGFNVHPAEVEAVIATCPGVEQVAVVGRPVAGNEEVVAFFTGDADPAALAAHAAAGLAPYKRPTRWERLEAMPASGTGKVLKHRLAAMARGLA
ncbi:class I adenylate-forming enzyme family protein [Humitalea sp. 24SJ18S-53]|uniref:class I adenylate-forming enzyme family protein n=1 Tax=Humitalea sp. 24SJ18S-53 TaxID=3422307 RepID=UPI003D6668B2